MTEIGHVWLCNVHSNLSASRGYRPVNAAGGGADSQDPVNVAFADIIERLEGHEPVAPDEMPPALFSPKDFSDHTKPKRHLLEAGGTLVISEESVAVLREHDLGATALVPVALLAPDRTTPVPGPWHYIVPGDAKLALRIGDYKGLHKFRGVELYMPNNSDMIAQDEIVFGPAALDGPDIWFDPAIFCAPFLSDRLAAALKHAKIAKHWELIRCRVEG